MLETGILSYFAVLLISFASGIVQTSTGFGAGIVMMTVLPSFFGVAAGAAINTSVVVALTVSLVFKFRKYIDFRKVFPLIVCYLITSIYCIRLTPLIDTRKIGIAFGMFLIAVSLFFLFFSSKIVLNDSLLSLMLCGLASGIFSGFFGVGGPLVAVYFLNITPDKKSYFANTQFVFLLTGIVNTVTRILSGIYTASLLPFSVVGLIGILFGKRIGSFISDRLRSDSLKLIVYIFVGVSGIMTVWKYLFI